MMQCHLRVTITTQSPWQPASYSNHITAMRYTGSNRKVRGENYWHPSREQIWDPFLLIISWERRLCEQLKKRRWWSSIFKKSPSVDVGMASRQCWGWAVWSVKHNESWSFTHHTRSASVPEAKHSCWTALSVRWGTKEPNTVDTGCLGRVHSRSYTLLFSLEHQTG